MNVLKISTIYHRPDVARSTCLAAVSVLSASYLLSTWHTHQVLHLKHYGLRVLKMVHLGDMWTMWTGAPHGLTAYQSTGLRAPRQRSLGAHYLPK